MAVPAILGSTKGTSVSAATSHTGTYPASIEHGELLMFIAVGRGTYPSNPTDSNSHYKIWRTYQQSSGGLNFTISFRYASGQESEVDDANGQFAFTTSLSSKVSWIMLRWDKKTIPVFHRVVTATNSSTIASSDNFFCITKQGDYNILNLVATLSDAAPTGASTGYAVYDSQLGADADGASLWIQKRDFTASADYTVQTKSALTLSELTDWADRTISFTFPSTASEGTLDIPMYSYEFSNNGYNGLNSTTPVLGISQAFKGNGELIKRVCVLLKRSAAVTGTIQCKLYNSTGTFGTSSVPSGTALATASNTVVAASLSTTNWGIVEFEFTTPIKTEFNESYAFTIECANISGGNIQISQAANTTQIGNASQSGNLTSWSVTSANDLTFFIQTIKNSSPYHWKEDFKNTTVVSNITYTGAESIRQHPLVRGVDISTSAATFVEQSIEYDPGLGKNIFRAKSINDNAGGDVDRAQMEIDYLHGSHQNDVIHWRVRMKFHPDIEYMEQYPTDFVSNAWFNIFEQWLEFKDSWTGDTGGAARWSLYLNKNTGIGQPLYWVLSHTTMQPVEEEDVVVWSSTNSSIAVPYGEWFILDWYTKKGSGAAGKSRVRIKVGTADWQTLFDVNNTTNLYPTNPELNVDRTQPIKVYAGDALMDFMTGAGKALEISYSEVVWYNPEVTLIEEVSYMGETYTGTEFLASGDLKITEMPFATNLATSVIPIVQSGINKQADIGLFQTLRTRTLTSTGVVTANADSEDMIVITALATGLNIANPTGSPTEGQIIIYRIKDNGAARALTYGTLFRALGTTLPTTTIISKLLYIACAYNSVDNRWDIINVIQQA